MGIDDMINSGKKLYEDNKAKIQDALKSEQAEGVSDKVLDGAEDLAKKVLPDEHDATIEGARDNVDKAVGNE